MGSGDVVRRIAPTTLPRVAVWLLVALLFVACWVAGWVWRHPQAFEPAGGWGMAGISPVGVPTYVGMSYDRDGEHGVATIHDARAHVLLNSAGARIDFFVCRVDGSSGVGAIGSVRGEKEIQRECLSLEPVDEARVRLGRAPMDQIVMAVTLTTPGRVAIDSAEVRYSRGWQTGTQSIGGEVRLRAPARR